MALEGVTLNVGVGGSEISVDQIGPLSYEVVKQAFGDAGAATMVAADNPLPVTDANAATELASILTALLGTLGISGTVSVSNFPAAITNYANESGGHLDSIDTKNPSLGAAATAASVPVNIASDQVVPVSLNVPTTINNGKTAVATAGTRVTLAASTVVKSVTIKALITNTQKIYVGNATVASTNGYQLSPGDSISLDIANLNTVNLDSDVSGEGVSYIGIV